MGGMPSPERCRNKGIAVKPRLVPTRRSIHTRRIAEARSSAPQGSAVLRFIRLPSPVRRHRYRVVTVDPLIYLDYQASTPVDPRVLEAMYPHLQRRFGNAASVQHRAGRAAARAADAGREAVADLVNARSRDVIFTSGATESNNLAIAGVAATHRQPGHIVSCQTEHPSVLEPLRKLEESGWRVTYLPVDSRGEMWNIRIR